MEGGAFDGARAAELTAELRRSFDSGRTRSYEWRAAQLKGIARMIEEKEADIMAALHDDLAKPQMESFLHEVPQIFICLRYYDPFCWTDRCKVGAFDVDRAFLAGLNCDVV